MNKIIKILLFLLLLTFLGTGLGYLALSSNPEFGGQIAKERQVVLKQSPQYSEEKFKNRPAQIDYDIWVNIEDFMGDQVRMPPGPFPMVIPNLTMPPSNGLIAYWLGHATVLVEMEGKRIITDPMLSEAAFPIQIIAPKRFSPPPIQMEDLPAIDIAIVSHDHYDHLDMRTIQHLSRTGTHFFVGLGVAVHLEKWEIPTDQIHELDWWDQVEFGDLSIHCTPARHYSGRTSMNNSTLWSSWVIKGSQNSIFHSGDSGYSPHFSEIGNRLGPLI